jgi:hypothetical protein
MARYKHIDISMRFIAVDLQVQLLPGTFEHALNHLIDHQLSLSCFDARFNNDATGATAYPSAMPLKIILFAYSRGIIISRNIERTCRESCRQCTKGPESNCLDGSRTNVAPKDRLDPFLA